VPGSPFSHIPGLDGRSAFLVLLSGLAGWIDAFSFTELGQVFTSFQSGNLIFLGLATGEGDWEQLLGAGVSVTAFVGGSALGAYLVGRARVTWPNLGVLGPAMAFQCALLIGFAICWQVVGEPGAYSAGRVILLVAAATAMGIQGAAVFSLRIPGVVASAMTASLLLGGILLGLQARGKGAAEGASELSGGALAAMCLSYVLCALAVGLIGSPGVTSAVPAGVLALVLLGMAVRNVTVRGAPVPG
jgi:uncharacterized membrane protein YoaK (UPF0700 family)